MNSAKLTMNLPSLLFANLAFLRASILAAKEMDRIMETKRRAVNFIGRTEGKGDEIFFV